VGLQVLLVGRLRPERGVTGTHEGFPVADVRHPEAVQDAIARLSGPDGSVLLMCGTDDVEEVRAQLNLVTVALPQTHVLLEPVPGSPLAVGVVAALVNDADGSQDPAVQLGLLDRLRDRVWSAVWLPSVARLERPHPSLTQHVRSWLGGSGFLAVHSPEPCVLTCPGQQMPALDVPAGGALMVADSGGPEWVVPALDERLGATGREQFATWRDPRDAFGTATCVEVLVVPADLDDADAVPSGTRECPACGSRHARQVCPWCRMADGHPTGPAADEPADDLSTHDPTGAPA